MRGILLRGWGITYMPGKNISLLDNATNYLVGYIIQKRYGPRRQKYNNKNIFSSLERFRGHYCLDCCHLCYFQKTRNEGIMKKKLILFCF